LKTTSDNTCEVLTSGEVKMDIISDLQSLTTLSIGKFSEMMHFINNLGEFTDSKADWRSLDEISGQVEEVELEDDNKIPKGLVPLERIFYLRDKIR
jgi:hypothetical protein